MDTETYDDLLEQIRAGKVAHYAGRSATNEDELNFIRDACSRDTGAVVSPVTEDPLAELKAQAEALGINPIPGTEKGLRKAIEQAQSASGQSSGDPSSGDQGGA